MMLLNLERMCYFGGIALLLILGFFAVRGGSYLAQSSQGVMLFRRRRAARAFAAVMGLFLAVGGSIILWPMMLIARDWVSDAVFMLLCIMGSIPLFWRSGPQELRLDLGERTYCLINGPPFFAKSHSGTWKDIAGVGVWAAHQGYFVSIVWSRGNRRGPILGQFRHQSDAARFAKEVSSALGLPRVSLSRFLA